MLRGRSALASVFLCSVCLLALPSQHPSKNRCSKDLFQRVKQLQSITLNQRLLNTSLYTPTTVEYQQKCPGFALRCFAVEVKVLIKELDISSFPVKDQVSGLLQRLASRFNMPELGCGQCELFQEENVETFLLSLEKTIEAMNNDNC